MASRRSAGRGSAVWVFVVLTVAYLCLRGQVIKAIQNGVADFKLHHPSTLRASSCREERWWRRFLLAVFFFFLPLHGVSRRSCCYWWNSTSTVMTQLGYVCGGGRGDAATPIIYCMTKDSSLFLFLRSVGLLFPGLRFPLFFLCASASGVSFE